MADLGPLRAALALSGLDLEQLWLRCCGYGSQLSALQLGFLLLDEGGASGREHQIARVVVDEALADLGLPPLAGGTDAGSDRVGWPEVEPDGHRVRGRRRGSGVSRARRGTVTTWRAPGAGSHPPR